MDSENAKVIIGILSVERKLIKSNIESYVFVFVLHVLRLCSCAQEQLQVRKTRNPFDIH